MTPARRRLLYAVTFEGFGILLSAVFLHLVSGAPISASLPLSIFASVLALVWSYVFNAIFETWERRQTVRGRSFKRRTAHALLYEATLSVFLLPATAWFLGVGVVQALGLELSLILFFLLYTWAFTWAFDAIFGLPQSAR